MANNYSLDSNFYWIFDFIPCCILFVILSYSGILYNIMRPLNKWLFDFFINYVKSSIKFGHSFKNRVDTISAVLEANLSIMKFLVCFPESSSLNKKFFRFILNVESN